MKSHRMRVWKIGTEAVPATPSELKAFKKKLKKALKKNQDLVWHHAVEVLEVKNGDVK